MTTQQKDEALTQGFKRWRKKSPQADFKDFEAGWHEALASLPASTHCECLTCREVVARYYASKPAL